jgi:hypothetical protein
LKRALESVVDKHKGLTVSFDPRGTPVSPHGEGGAVRFCLTPPGAQPREQELVKEGCDAYCDEINTKPDWCSSGLSTGALVGIIVPSVVVAGVGIGVAVYFLLIRKNVKESIDYSHGFVSPH